MKTLFENQNLIAVHKPAGWLSVPSTQGKADPRPVVGIELQKQLGSVFPVHRLDFEVGGVLLFAKNSREQTRLQGLWQNGKVTKTYRALTPLQNFAHWPENIKGSLQDKPSAYNEWVSFLAAGKKRAFVAPHGMKSVTIAEIIKSENDVIEWQLNPVTGRRHQLRVELSRRGFPIWGDALYGSSIQGPQDEIALQAIRLEIADELQIVADWNWNSWLKK